MPKPWRWMLTSQRIAVRNARHATVVLAQRRREREAVDAYLASLDRISSRTREASA
jgi:hypothetical protein